MTQSTIISQKNYQLRNLHVYIKNDDLNALIGLLNKKPSLLKFKNFKNENILFYSLLCNSKKISSYLMIQKPSLLLERNNLGRNAAQNIASKNLDLSLLFKGLSLLEKSEVYQVFSNVDNLGNNLLMYSCLYENINNYNKSIKICPGIKTLQQFQNKKKSNVLHFLASNNYEGEIDLTEHDKTLFLHKTNNDTSVAMFAAENQPLNRFKSYLIEYQKHLSQNEFLKFLEFRNLIGFNILDFAFLNKNSENAQYLINNYPSNFDKNFKPSNILTLLKSSIKNNNINNFQMILEHYNPFENETTHILPIIQISLLNNDKNSLFLDYLLDNNLDLIIENFSNPSLNKNNIYEYNLDKINSDQWKTILDKIIQKNETILETTIELLFLNMMYNPKYAEKNLDTFYNFLQKTLSKDNAIIYIAQKLLYLNNNLVENFIEKHNFIDECKQKDIDTLIFIFQKLYSTKTAIPKNELNLSLVLDNSNYTKTLNNNFNKYSAFTKITQMDKIIEDPELFSAFNQITNCEYIIVKHIAQNENIFSNFFKISNYLSEKRNKYFFGLLFYEITYMPAHSIEYKKEEWDIFMNMYSQYIKTSIDTVKETVDFKPIPFDNENKEYLENLIDILTEHIIPNTNIEYQLYFFDFISKNFQPFNDIVANKKIFIQNLAEKLLNNINQEPLEKKENLINKIISINTNLYERNIPINISNYFLQFINQIENEKYLSSKVKYFSKCKNLFLELNNFYSKTDIDEKILHEIVSLIPSSANQTDSNLNISLDIKFFAPYLMTEQINEDKNPFKDATIKIDNTVFYKVYCDYLKEGNISNIMKLHQLYLAGKYFTIENFNLNPCNDILINMDNKFNLYDLMIYSYNNFENLMLYKEPIENYLHDLKISNLSLPEKIFLLTMCEKLNIINDIPELINIIEEHADSKNKTYNTLLENFILKHHANMMFDDVNFEKISNQNIKLILENSYLERKIPLSTSSKKVLKF